MTARRWILIVSLLTILVLSSVVALLFPLFAGPEYVGPEHLKEFLLTQLERNLGREIEVGRVHLKVFPSIQLEFADFVIRDIDPQQVFLKAKRANLVLRLFPLFRGRLVGKRFTVEEPTLELRRDQQGHWNFLSVFQVSENGDQSIGSPLRRVLILRELTIRNGQLSIVDESRPDGTRAIRFGALDLAMMAQPTRRQADVYLSAAIPTAVGTTSLSLAGTFMQGPSQVRIAEEEPEAMLPTFQFEGTAEAANVDVRQLADFLGPRPIPEHVSGAVNLHGRVRLVPGVVGYDMVLSDMTARVKQVTLGGRASLSGLLTGQPTLTVTFSSSQMQIRQLLDTFPAQWIHPQLHTIIKERDVRGTLEVVTATLTGVMTPEPHLSLTGEFRVKEGHALIDEAGTPVENVSGTVLLETGRLRVVELSGMYGKMRVDAGKALVSFLDAGPWLELKLKGEKTAADLVAEINAGQSFRSKGLRNAWKGLHEINGVALVDFRLSGPLNNPKKIKYVGAAFEALDVSFRTPLLPERVTGLHGRLAVSDKGTQFDGLRGWVGQTQFHVQGRVTPNEKNAFEDLTITTRAGAGDLIALLPAGTFTGPPPKGTIGAVVGLSGRLTAPRFKGKLDLDDSGIDLPVLGNKPRGRQAALEFDGALGKRAVPFIHRVELVLPTLRVTSRGTIRLDKRFRINSDFGFGPIAVNLLPDWMRPAGLQQGEIEVSLDVRGKGRDWRAWQITGWVAVTDGVFSAKGMDSSARDVNLRVKLVPNGAELKQLAFRVLDSEARLTGVIRNWQKDPFAALTVESSHFDVDLLVPKGKQSAVRHFLADLAASTRVTAKADFKRATYKRLQFTDLTGRVNIAKGVLDIDRIKGKSLTGQLEGRIVVRLPKRRPGSSEAILRIAGLPFEDFHSLFNKKMSPVDGNLFLTASIRGHGKDRRGVYATLNGKTDLRIEEGRIFKDDNRAIWKILSVLSIPAQLQGKVDLDKDGFPFDEITATMVIEDGRIKSEDIRVNSPVVKITAAGSYDIPNDDMDYIVAVSPFGPYSAMLQSIPLFGKLLKGDRQGLDTALFEVKGPLENPDVEYMPLRSFASGIGGLGKLAVDLLVNLVTLPKEMIAPSEDDNQPKVDQLPEMPEPATP